MRRPGKHRSTLTKRDRNRRHDAKRRYDKPWRNLYKTKRWRLIRQAQLTLHRLCERCLPKGKLIAAEVVHHVEPHRGDPVLFYSGPFQSICKPCHNSDAQGEERRGYSNAIGADGWPTDPKHPANRGEIR